MTGREVVDRLLRHGFVILRQKGSHVRLVGPNGNHVTVPVHTGVDLPRGTLANIARQSGIALGK